MSLYKIFNFSKYFILLQYIERRDNMYIYQTKPRSDKTTHID